MFWSTVFDMQDQSNVAWYTAETDADGNRYSEIFAHHHGTHALYLGDVANQYAWMDATVAFDANWNITGVYGDWDHGSPRPLTMADIQQAYDTALWFATPYDPNQG